MMRPPTLVFCTGGTGGHIYPAVAVAEAVSKEGYGITFIGQQDGMEASLVPKAGFAFVGVPAGKWDRGNPDPRQAIKALQGLSQAVQLMNRVRPDLVIGFGGFASFPGLAAAKLLNRPIMLHEGNAFPGKVTRWFARSAKCVVLSQPAAQSHLSIRGRVETIPLPIREKRMSKQEARRRLGIADNALVTLVMGGSQGSLALNNAVPDAYEQLNRSDVTVLHSSGERWETQLRERTAGFKNYHVHGFLDATTAWSAADVAITRSGISTLSEAAFHGVPLLMVPLPSAAENHQYHNAVAVASAGAGTVVEESNIQDLATSWQLYLQTDTRAQAAQAALALSPAGSANQFANIIKTLIRPGVHTQGVTQESA